MIDYESEWSRFQSRQEEKRSHATLVLIISDPTYSPIDWIEGLFPEGA
jgi:hypothetical protein